MQPDIFPAPAVTLAMVATSFENANGIVRGATESVQTARIFGWGQAAFPDCTGGFFFVYMLAPVLGGQIAALLFTSVLEPLMKTRNENQCYCGN